VAGVIVGVRRGLSDHQADYARVFGMQLDAANLAPKDTVVSQSSDL
jgi:hypothetical protein